MWKSLNKANIPLNMDYEEIDLDSEGIHIHLELTDPDLISCYNDNPERFSSYILEHLYTASVDIFSGERLDRMISNLNGECLQKKMNLIKNMLNPSRN